MAPAQWEVEVGQLRAAMEGCRQSEQEERERVHARLDLLESTVRAMAADLTFLRGRLSGGWMVLMGGSAAGGVLAGILTLIRLVQGG